MPTYLSLVHTVMLSMKHQRSSTVQEGGLTNELHKQTYDKKGNSTCVHKQGYRLCVRWTYFQEKKSQLSPPTLFEEPLKFIDHGRILR